MNSSIITSHPALREGLSQRILLGIPIGLVIIYTVQMVYFFFNGSHYYQDHPILNLSPVASTLAATFISILLGVCQSLASRIFDWVGEDGKNLLPITALHWSAMLLVTFMTMVVLGLEPKFWPILSFAVTFTLIYVLIWWIIYLHTRRQVAELNQSLEQSCQ